ncbi:hypothetical protein F2P56_034958 [Juglans regia]|uniref:Diacylglycerol O-acyltransferase n=1 Tax=Juglans regia TaxID=51240 RepID=A0A833WSD5_JUGRE|nr:hypothetical protein F2P56_034958 [Juglans regia]
MMMGDHVKATRNSHHDEEPLSPAARFFHAPRFNVYIIAIMGCKTRINPDVVKAGLEQTLVKHPRFSSKMVVDGNKYCKNQKWTRTKVNLEDHIIVPELDPNIDFPDRFVEDYVSNVTRTPLDLSKPLWELHILNIKTSDAEAVGVFRIHHSMGDGASLVSLLLACTRKTSDPEALPSVPVRKRAAERQKIRASDSQLGRHKAREECNEHGGEEQKDGRVKQSNSNIPKGIRLRTAILVNLRKSAGIQDMADMMAKGSKIRGGNVIGYLFLPFTIALQDDPLDYVRKAKAIIDRKKLSLEPIFTSTSLGLVFRTFGTKVTTAIMRRALSNITMAISGMIGPQEEISFYGHPIAYLAPTVYGGPSSLVVHFQSYVNKMTISLSADPSVIPDPHELCNNIEESLKLVRDAALNKGLIKLQDVV